MLGAVTLDEDNHLFNVAYAIVLGEDNDDLLWFCTVFHEFLGGIKPIIMTDRYELILYVMPRVFGLENHCYYVIHVRENLVGYAAKLGI